MLPSPSSLAQVNEKTPWRRGVYCSRRTGLRKGCKKGGRDGGRVGSERSGPARTAIYRRPSEIINYACRARISGRARGLKCVNTTHTRARGRICSADRVDTFPDPRLPIRFPLCSRSATLCRARRVGRVATVVYGSTKRIVYLALRCVFPYFHCVPPSHVSRCA